MGDLLNFPKIRKALGSLQLVKQEDIDENPTVKEGRAGLARLMQRYNGGSAEDAVKQVADNETLAQQGGMMAGTISNLGAKAMQAGPGIEGVLQAQDMANMMPAGENLAAQASKKILDAEHLRRIQLIKEMASKNKPKWGN